MTIAFKELAGSPVEMYALTGMTAERRLLCAFEDRYALVTTLLAGGLIGASPSPGGAYPGQPSLVPVRIRIEPFQKNPDAQGPFDDPTADMNSYSGQFVAVVINYEMLGDTSSWPKPQENILLTYRMDFGGEYMKPAGHQLQWQSDAAAPVPPETVPTLRTPIAEHCLTWHHVGGPPWAAIRGCIGAVNAVYFMGAAPETVLFDGAKAQRSFSGLDSLQQPQFGWDVTYVFREKTIKVLDNNQQQLTCGWNHAYCVDSESGPGWDRLIDANGNTLYRKVDFSPLFQPAE